MRDEWSESVKSGRMWQRKKKTKRV